MVARDILFLVLATCAVVLTAFVAWFLFYLVAIVRDLRSATRAVHEKVDQVGSILEAIKERIGDSASAIALLTQVVTKVAGSWRARRSRRSSSDQPDE